MSDRSVHFPFVYDAELLRVIDGDTVDLQLTQILPARPLFATSWVDEGFHTSTRVCWLVIDGRMEIVAQMTRAERVRLLGVDTPERGRPGWAAAGDFVRQWFATHSTCSLECATTKSDSFGRYLGTIDCPAHTSGLNTELLLAGHAVPYAREVPWVLSQDDSTQEV